MSKKGPVLVSYSTPVIAVRFIETLLDESTAMLIRYGENQEDAKKMSRQFVVEVGQKIGGSLLYIGKNSLIEAQQRRFQIREEFNHGESVKVLSDKYQLSTRQIDAICKEIQDTAPAKAATKGADFIAVVSARMFMKIGENIDDATSAARGLLAVIAAKFGGKQFCIPRGNCLNRLLRMIDVYRLDRSGYSHAAIAGRYNLTEDQVAEISDAYPARTMPDSSELPKIKIRLFNMAATFSGHAEINTLLESATENISRAEQIIEKLEGVPL
ncbi:MAG TPA: Mor transcription activator family protein [Desulfuromonadaceae bacterium]